MKKVIIKKISDIDDSDYLKIYNELDDKHKSRIKNYNSVRLKQHLASLFILKQNNICLKKIKYNENGKPYTNNINFSVSHSDEYVVVAFSNRRIGIDIEKIKDYNHLLLKYLNISDEILSNKDFFVEYTKKESLIKMLGLKLSDMNVSYNMCEYEEIYIKDYVISLCTDLL